MEHSEALDLSGWLRPAAGASINAAVADSTAYVSSTGYVRPPDEQASIYFREHSSAVYRYLAGVYGREEDA